MPPITTALFDLDGTLLDSLGVWSGIDLEFLASFDIQVPGDYFGAVSAMPFDAAARYTIQRFNLPLDTDEVLRIWDHMASHHYANTVVAKPGAKQYLTKLKQHGVRLAVSTTLRDPLAFAALKTNGMDGLFDGHFCSHTIGISKTDPAFFTHLLAQLGTGAASCCVFDDLPGPLAAAKTVGIKPYGVRDTLNAGTHTALDAVAVQVIQDFTHGPWPL